MDDSDFRSALDRHFVLSVRNAAQAAFEEAAWAPVHEAYLALAFQLRKRGIEPDPEAVFDGAVLISQGRKPPVMRKSGGADQ